MLKLNSDEQSYLIKLARESILSSFNNEKPNLTEVMPSVSGQKLGVFVSLLTYPDCELRGCVGSLYSTKEVTESIIESSVNAAFHDSKFMPLSKSEFEDVLIEVNILTKPEIIKVDDPLNYPREIKLGKDGLILKFGSTSGLLLPQVPLEFGWNTREYLEHLCEKASLPKDMWKSLNVEISKFNAITFKELQPKGEVVIKKCYR